MRVSVWAIDANPEIDPRMYRQSLSRCEFAVNSGKLRWVDMKDKTKGCFLSKRIYNEVDSLKFAAGSGFAEAWSIRQSGYGGPLTWQLKTGE